MGFFSKRKAANKAATDEVDAWLRTANEASEHDALDMVDVDQALGAVMPKPPAAPDTATETAGSLAIETFDPSTVADSFQPADDAGEMWHFPELDEGSTDAQPPMVERRAQPVDAPTAATDEPSTDEPSTTEPSTNDGGNVSPAPSMFDMLAAAPPEHLGNPRPESEVEVEGLGLAASTNTEPWTSDPDPLGNVALTTGGDMEDVWATFDALSPAPESDALDDLWGKKDRRAAAADSSELAPSDEPASSASPETFDAVVDFHAAPAAPSVDLDSPDAFAGPVVDFGDPTEPGDEPSDAPSPLPPAADVAPGPAPFEAAPFEPASFDETWADEQIDAETLLADSVEAETVPTDIEVPEIDPVYGPLPVPASPQTELLLEILGLEPGCDWSVVRHRRAELIEAHAPSSDDDEDRAALALDIRHEMNSAYAALRLYFVG